ncbi:MAG: hypothetical protein OXB84_03250, partial [Halobacteriovoraceae bacterium]|nr:hypothetical protein [Halobacteriovoraceae bacterium]
DNSRKIKEDAALDDSQKTTDNSNDVQRDLYLKGLKRVKGDIPNNNVENKRLPASFGAMGGDSGYVERQQQKLQNLLREQQGRIRENQGAGGVLKMFMGIFTPSSNDESLPKPSLILAQSLAFFQILPAEKLKAIFNEKLEGTFLKTWSDKYPQVIDFLVVVLKDEEALPAMTKILDDKTNIRNFIIANIVVFFIGIFWRRLRRNAERTYFGRIVGNMASSFFLLGVRFSLIFVFFYTELAPLGSLFTNHFFS